MAIGKAESELLKKFWDNNQNIILAALNSFISDPEQPEEDREIIEVALQEIKRTGRDRSQIILTYKDKTYGPFLKADIGYQAVKCLEENGQLNDKTIEWLKNNESCSYKLIKTIDMIKPKEAFKYRTQNRDGSIKDPELTFNGVGYYIARNWGVPSRDEFIKLIQAKFKGMQYEIIPQAN